MNIRDIGNLGNAPESSRFDTENVNENVKIEQPIEQRDQVSVPERSENPEEYKDEYIRSLTNTVKSTLYKVTDVRQSRISQIRKQIQNEKYNPGSDEVAEKIVDILLPLGMKTLSVYKKL